MSMIVDLQELTRLFSSVESEGNRQLILSLARNCAAKKTRIKPRLRIVSDASGLAFLLSNLRGESEG